MSNNLEAKIVVLGSQGVGKTSLIHRFIHSSFPSASYSSSPHANIQPQPSTIGASFHTKRLHSPEDDTTIRLQIWDTAGQERFRAISKLYYRGASAAVLCYSVTDSNSFEEMGRWLRELKENVTLNSEGGDGEDGVIVHVVGTKSDLVAEDPGKREVPFERCIAYVAENLHPVAASTPPASATRGYSSAAMSRGPSSQGGQSAAAMTPGATGGDGSRNRNSGFWGQDVGWDCCHEISAKDGEGVEEMFRVITRKLVEQRTRKLEREDRASAGVRTGAGDSASGGAGHYYDGAAGWDGLGNGNGSFRVGYGDKRRSWLGIPPGLGFGIGTAVEDAGPDEGGGEARRRRGGKCC